MLTRLLQCEGDCEAVTRHLAFTHSDVSICVICGQTRRYGNAFGDYVFVEDEIRIRAALNESLILPPRPSQPDSVKVPPRRRYRHIPWKKWRHTLSDEDAWAHPESLYARRPQHYRVTVTWDDPTECDYCGSTQISWNGRQHYCDICHTPLFGDAIETREDVVGTLESIEIAPIDEWYARETQLYRVPASTLWPHGRLNPQVRALNEGKPRRKYGYEPYIQNRCAFTQDGDRVRLR